MSPSIVRGAVPGSGWTSAAKMEAAAATHAGRRRLQNAVFLVLAETLWRRAIIRVFKTIKIVEDVRR
jgi:hypothetical protein